MKKLYFIVFLITSYILLLRVRVGKMRISDLAFLYLHTCTEMHQLQTQLGQNATI